MPPQHIEVAETVLALKKKLLRDSDAQSDRPITSATNRGNKLRRGAQYVQAGALSYPHGPNGYKERITHAGYQRYILDRNPRRYNELGDELDDSESDVEADADAEEENPYSQVRLDELLRPLTHAAELTSHPTLSQPYLDPALPEIIKDIEQKLRHERANIWRAKNLYRHFVGDETWIPLERVEDTDDWDLFAPHNTLIAGERSPKRRRLSAENAENNIDAQDQAPRAASDQDSKSKSKADHEVDDLPNAQTDASSAPDPAASVTKDEAVPDTSMTDAKNDPEEPSVNGIGQDDNTKDDQNGEDAAELDGADAASLTSSPAPPPRRITRALAAENNTSRPTTPDSQTSNTLSNASPSLFSPAATFLLPAQLQLAHSSHASGLPLSVAHSGLSPEEILETRKLLQMYIQKSEETVRGLHGLYSKLIRLKRRRDKVWEWCKAEGHVGELSDGEDWIDHEAWGLRIEDLRKGRDEEEGAQQVSIELETNAEGVVERRKGKRRRGAKD